MHNQSFNGINIICNYKENIYGVVTNESISIGETIDITNGTGATRIYREVAEIIEERPSQGVFKEGTEIPTWYKLKVAA